MATAAPNTIKRAAAARGVQRKTARTTSALAPASAIPPRMSSAHAAPALSPASKNQTVWRQRTAADPAAMADKRVQALTKREQARRWRTSECR